MSSNDRRYLYVPFEEYPEVKALRARWDNEKKCWYIGPRQDAARFKRWLDSSAAADGEFLIESNDAYVAKTKAECRVCGAKTEVICVYCEKGVIEGEIARKFTVSNVSKVDECLARQLEVYPQFRKDSNEETGADGFMNHCSNCGNVLDDFFLHSEPGGPFFGRPAKRVLKKLKGKVRLTGDEGFAL